MNLDWIPNSPPSREVWEYRRTIYDYIWDNCIHPEGSTTSQHADSLKLELERCFCAGAWVACIILAASIVEVHLSHLGSWKNSSGQNLLEDLNINKEWDSLRDRRNMLIHGERGSDKNDRLSSQEYRHEREKFQEMAEESIHVALKVALNNPFNFS